jgi:hypothetical protein
MTQYDVSGRDALANIAHSQGFRAAADQGGSTFVEERSSVYSIKQKDVSFQCFSRSRWSILLTFQRH